MCGFCLPATLDRLITWSCFSTNDHTISISTIAELRIRLKMFVCYWCYGGRPERVQGSHPVVSTNPVKLVSGKNACKRMEMGRVNAGGLMVSHACKRAVAYTIFARARGFSDGIPCVCMQKIKLS